MIGVFIVYVVLCMRQGIQCYSAVIFERIPKLLFSKPHLQTPITSSDQPTDRQTDQPTDRQTDRQ